VRQRRRLQVDSKFQLLSIPTWFRVDHSTGSPIVELDRTQCFAATMSHEMVHLPKPPLHVNIGQVVLHTLFATWKDQREQAKSKKELAKEQTDDGEENVEKDTENKKEEKKDAPPATDVEEKASPLLPMSSDTVVMIVNTENGRVICQSSRSEFNGTEQLPRWVEDCVLRDQYTTRVENKYCFYIRPSDTDTLPALPSGDSKLSSLRWLTVTRISEYIKSRLELVTPPRSVSEADSEKQETSEQDKENPGEEEDVPRISASEYLELLCQDQVLEPSLDLAAIKTFFWKASGDMVLYYRRRSPYREQAANTANKEIPSEVNPMTSKQEESALTE